MSDDIPEPDCAPGAPHPRETAQLFGQEQAEQSFLDVFNSGRLHHAWLITGPRGVGKATLAWKIARFLLATPKDDGGMFGAPKPPSSLDISPGHPVIPRVLALSEPRLFLLRRAWDDKRERLQSEITVDPVRALKGFFELSAVDGGRRVVIVDSADEMNVNAANAVLKLLEEPPDDTVILLISHQPSRLLPTIRSRCRSLRCRSLSAQDMQSALQQADVESDVDTQSLAALSGGSAGDALRLITLDGVAQYARIIALFDKGLDRPGALKLADGLTGRAKADELLLVLDLFDLFLSRLARYPLSSEQSEAVPGEHSLFAKLCPTPAHSQRWAVLQQDLSARARHAHAVNLDPGAMILDITLKIHDCASTLAA